MVVASPRIHAYFESIEKEVSRAHKHASLARLQGKDPGPLEIQLAKNMAERVVGLISVIAPQIVGSGVVERIIELEKLYGALSWRVALQIAQEIAEQKFCSFKSREEAMDVGIRTGFAYSTVGVVSSPLDGIINIEFKDRRDGRGKYMCVNYGGPIRNAGGTNAALSVIIADHVRKAMGFDVYDASEEEIKRACTEIVDYHERITNLQYVPHVEEIVFLMRNLPVEVSGDPSERVEVSNFKDLPRIPTNQIRSGFCLILSSCIPLKAPKLWKQLGKWGKDAGLDQWFFLEEYISVQKKAKAKAFSAVSEKKEVSSKIAPDFTYIADLVAGRPVLSFPLAKGGFRLRYGRSRASGLSAQGLHPATMHVLENYIATGTQLKVERPGKSAAYTPCDTIEGPIVKLDDGSVILLNSEARAKEVKKRVAEILFLGDVLVDYGDFANRNHVLVPPGYCEEWWVLELERALKGGGVVVDAVASASKVGMLPERLKNILSNPLYMKPSIKEALSLSGVLGVPLHPLFTIHWSGISKEDFLVLLCCLQKGVWYVSEGFVDKIVLPFEEGAKRVLEILGCSHVLPVSDTVVIERDMAAALGAVLNVFGKDQVAAVIEKVRRVEEGDVLKLVNLFSSFPVRDKSGTFIGARMGRPEKAKMRKLTGSPHGLFPVGEEGGKLRSLLAAVEVGKVTCSYVLRKCLSCKCDSVYLRCERCNAETIQFFFCRFCNQVRDDAVCAKHGPCNKSREFSIDVRHYFQNALSLIDVKVYPELIKGVRGTVSEDHIPEHAAKGVLRAMHNVFVNKDGTIRYDCGELTLTHFRPMEIGTSVVRLREFGYTHDCFGVLLERDDQVLELLPQDVVLPCCPDSPDEHADVVCLRISAFVDELLVRFYKMGSFYNCRTRDDLVGHLIIGLAPHTSAGMVGRIIGFSKTQGFLAHPNFHQACRRDCDGDELGFMLLMDAFLNFSKKFLPNSRGNTMDTPLVLSSMLIPTEVDDQAFDVGIAWSYPLEFYQAACDFKMPYELSIPIPQVKHTLNTEKQYEGMGFTHDTADINVGVLCSSYKTLPSMEEKLQGQMSLARKIRAVKKSAVAQLVIEKHFMKDTKGNLRKFSQQEFRCVNCNAKYRRPPLAGFCLKCKGRLLFTISEGSVVKYLGLMESVAKDYGVSDYLVQVISLLSQNVESYFGKEKEKQLGLGGWA